MLVRRPAVIAFDKVKKGTGIPARFQRHFSSPAASLVRQGEEDLWVKSKLPDVEAVTGLTIPELIRENFGSWGNLVAFVSV